MQYIVSIIIPLYNVADCVINSLISALNQEYKSIEFVLVDDCSTDNTMSIVNALLDNHPRRKDVYLIRHSVNRGLSAARNTGIDNAHGKYVFFLDSDDILSTDCIIKHVKEIENSGADFTDANINLVSDKKNRFVQYSRICKLEQPELCVSLFNNRLHVSAWNKLYRRSFLVENNLRFKEGLIYEDILWTVEMLCVAKSAVLLEDYTYSYIIRSDSITTSFNSEKIAKQYDSIERILYEFSAMPVESKYYHKCLCKYASLFRFKALARLVSIKQLDKATKYVYYQKLTSKAFKEFSIGLYGILSSLPYSLFNLCFARLYRQFVSTNS